MRVYVVTMQRWGDSESHNYVQGVFSSSEAAELCGEAEKAWRGGKYEACVTIHEVDEQDSDSMGYWEECQ